jgi:hypothetical protein
LYGLKHSPDEWNHSIDAYFLNQKFEKNYASHSGYFKRVKKNFYVIIILYVDDLILASNDLTFLKETKDYFSKKFEMVDLNEIQYCLRIQINCV